MTRLVGGLAVVCALAASAAAQGLDAERFVPSVGAEGTFVNEHPAVPLHLGWGLGVFANYVDDPLTEKDAAGNVIGYPVSTGISADLVASLGLFSRVELGIGLPVHFVWTGDDYGTYHANGGLGDLRFVPKVALVRVGSLDTHFLLSLAMPVTFPTGDDMAFRGAGGFTLLPELLLAAHFGRFGIGFDIGYHWRAQHPPLPYADSIALGPWLSVGLGDKVVLRAEMFAEKHLTDNAGGTFPVELLAGPEFRITESFALYAAGSLGLTDGVGAPDFRIIAGLRYHTTPSKGHDSGHPEDQGFRDSDNDDVQDKDDKEPYEPEDQDGFEDDDGVPDPDNDGDGIPDEQDECPELSGDREHDGCPAKTYVKIENGKIIIFGKVQFRTGSAEIDRRSEPLLDQIGEALNANPQVKEIEIQGHTDNVGGRAINERLSQERAASVKSALEKRNVDGGRLATHGYGETRPLAPNKSPGGRAKNRRVEFVIRR